MSLSDTFRKLFGFKTAEVEAERDALKRQVAELHAQVKTLRSEKAAYATVIDRLNQQLNAALAKRTSIPLEPEPPQVALAEASAAFVEESFRKIAGLTGNDGMLLFAYGRDGMARVPLDGKYQLPATRADLEAMIAWGLDEDKKYAEDFYDCENYAIYLKGKIDRQFLCNGVGVVIDWTSLPGAHAYNVAMLADGIVLVIEPQDGKVYTLQEKSALYRALTGVMLF